MKTTNNKMKLMGGASTALLATLISSQAVAQTVEIGSTVNVSGVDAVAGSNQAVTNDVDANVTNAKSTQSAGAVTDGSIAVQKSTTGAVAVGNTDTLSLSKTDTASLSTTTAVTALQTNTGTAAGTDPVTAENPVVIDADTTGTEVSVTVGATTRGSYAVKDSTDGATATGNTVAQSLTLSATTISASSDIGVDNDALKLDISGKAMGAVVQTNTITDVSATNLNSDMKVVGGNADSSALSLTGNTQDASATGNSSTQGVSLSATTLSTGGTYATVDTAGTQDLDANGKVVAASLQLNTDSTVEAYATDATATLDVGTATSAAVAMTGNTQSSGATGSTATNGLSLSGTTVGAGAVVVSQQENDATSTVLAQTQSSMLLQADSLNTGASTKLTDNTIQSRATGVITANTMTVDATTVTLAAPDGDVATTIASNAGTMEAAYAMLNDQQVAGDVTATTVAESTSSAIKLNVTETAGVIGGSTVQNDSNTLSARAQGATTANTLTLSVSGTLSQATQDPAVAGDIANAAAIGNVQTVSDGADVKATVDTGTADSIVTSVAGVLTSSSLSSSSNRLQATAEGATAINKLTASATTLTLGADTGTGAKAPASVYDAATATATADTAFSVANVQNSGNGTISAKLLDPATVATNVDGNVSASSVAANSNGFDAFATSNKATNSVALNGTTVTTDAGIVSAQTSNADVISRIGYSDAATAVAGSSPNDAGVTIDLGGTVDDSAVSVNANVTRGSAVANTSNNTLTASANSLTGDGTAVQAAASGDATLGEDDTSSTATATGDYSLANWQSLGGSATSTTQIAASYGIDQADSEGGDQLLSDSRLSVSNNVQFGEALGNSATNRIALTATDSGSGIDPTAALSNVQDGDTADVEASSRMNVFANGEALNSSIALNNNSNTSLGVINNASNTVSVSAVKLDGANSTASFATGTDTATADYAMLNLQSAGGDLDSTATTTLFNTDYADTAGALGTEDSKVAINGNATTAEASANRVANVMQFSAVDNGATAALGNSQSSTASVDATATTTARFAISTTGETNVAVDGSAVNMDGNSTTALARGNSASNAMTYSVGATYSGVDGAAITGTSSAAATAVVLNDQYNGGAVNALAQNAVYSVAFNDGASGTAASGSAFSNSNNAVNALAYGNSAVNSLNMSTFGAGLPSSAVSSVQANNGVVTATATSVQFSMTATGTTTGSVMRSTGNSVTAQAVGNSSVSTIGGGGI